MTIPKSCKIQVRLGIKLLSFIRGKSVEIQPNLRTKANGAQEIRDRILMQT